jgi:plastocyanin
MVTIEIRGMLGSNSYAPNPGSVAVGQQVVWHNADSIPHTATGTGFDTGILSPGATSSPITFTTAGQRNYFCTLHANMTGTLNVTQ